MENMNQRIAQARVNAARELLSRRIEKSRQYTDLANDLTDAAKRGLVYSEPEVQKFVSEILGK